MSFSFYCNIVIYSIYKHRIIVINVLVSSVNLIEGPVAVLLT